MASLSVPVCAQWSQWTGADSEQTHLHVSSCESTKHKSDYYHTIYDITDKIFDLTAHCNHTAAKTWSSGNTSQPLSIGLLCSAWTLMSVRAASHWELKHSRCCRAALQAENVATSSAYIKRLIMRLWNHHHHQMLCKHLAAPTTAARQDTISQSSWIPLMIAKSCLTCAVWKSKHLIWYSGATLHDWFDQKSGKNLFLKHYFCEHQQFKVFLSP